MCFSYNSRMKGGLVELGLLLNLFRCKLLICQILKKRKSGQINFSHTSQITKLGKGMSNLVI